MGVSGVLWGIVLINLFLGEYEYRLDQKGRLTVPPRFRAEFVEGIVVTRGYDACLVAYSSTKWDRLAETYAAMSDTDRGSRLINRLVFSSAFKLMLGSLGRLSLPLSLKSYAHLEDDVVLAGIGSHLEIWSKHNWGKEKTLMEEKASEIALGMNI